MYDRQDSIRLHDLVEVVGVLSYAPWLADQQGGEDGSMQACMEEMVLGKDDEDRDLGRRSQPDLEGGEPTPISPVIISSLITLSNTSVC